MRLLWHGRWLEAPCYTVPPNARLIRVEAARSLGPISHAVGRIHRRPYLKTWTFLRTDGPQATYRKVRTKVREHAFSGDYHLSIVLGALADAGTRVVALAPRMPAAASYLLARERLVREVPPTFSVDDFARLTEHLAQVADGLAAHARQTYLYSGEDPPEQLEVALDDALGIVGHVMEPNRDALLLPPDAAPPPKPVLRLAEDAGEGTPVALLGAGDYARTQIVPALSRRSFARVALADREPQIATLAARAAGFAVATTDAEAAIAALPSPGVVFISTYHDSHASLAAAALRRGHAVFLEKPAVVTEDDLTRLLEALLETRSPLEVGFNRRYNPLVRRARRLLDRETGPVTVTCVVKELALERDHWCLWRNQGTRVTGNLCHWLDLGVFLGNRDATPVFVTVTPPVSDGAENEDVERAVSVSFDDGSVVTVIATERGDDLRGVHELVDVRRGALTLTIDDLWRLTARSDGRTYKTRTLWRDKGHRRMFAAAPHRLAAGFASYPIIDLVTVAVVQMAASHLVATGGVQADVEMEGRHWRALTTGSA
jgi:predicted dehydrogenase